MSGWHFARVCNGDQLAVLSVIPVSFPAALHIAVGFAVRCLAGKSEQPIWGAGYSRVCYGRDRAVPAQRQPASHYRWITIALIAAILWKGAIADITFLCRKRNHLFPAVYRHGDHVLGICGIEAFTHLSLEFKNPERDFPRALIIGLMLAGTIYWACTAVVLHFWRLYDKIGNSLRYRLLLFISSVSVRVVGSLHYWLPHLLCQPECVCFRVLRV